MYKVFTFINKYRTCFNMIFEILLFLTIKFNCNYNLFKKKYLKTNNCRINTGFLPFKVNFWQPFLNILYYHNY